VTPRSWKRRYGPSWKHKQSLFFGGTPTGLVRIMAANAKRQRQTQDSSTAILNSADVVAKRLGTSVHTISRWRRRLSVSPQSFETTLQEAIDRYGRLLEFDSTGTRGLGLSLAVEWYTPARYLEAARAVLGSIDLDPASSPVANRRVKAAAIYTADDDGLSKDWPGRVWLNPPYSGIAGDFIARLVEQFKAGITTAAVALVNAHSTDVAWFQPLWDFPLCFTDHRINFIVGDNQKQSGSNHGSVFAYLGPERSAFIDRFTQFGAVVERAR